MAVSPLVSHTTSDLADGLRAFTDMGFEVAYSHIFVEMARPVVASKELLQSVGYAKLTEACMQVPQCVGMSTRVSVEWRGLHLPICLPAPSPSQVITQLTGTYNEAYRTNIPLASLA
jgi:hypothetical protein